MVLAVYTNEQLLEMTGISSRQLRSYREKRLISAPLPRTTRNEDGKYPIWGEQHVAQIRMIQEIREQNRTLADIREIVQGEHDE